MKKVLMIICACAFAVAPLFSVTKEDAKAIALLSKLSENIAALGNYRVEFNVDAEAGRTQGRYIVSGNNFRITTPQFEIIGNGSSRYEINHELREVIVDVMDSTDINILVNPVKAFEFARSGFVPSSGGEIEVGGVVCYFVEMKPAVDSLPINGIRLYVGRDSGLPVRLEYGLDGLDEKVALSVSSIRKDADIKPSDFLFDKSKYKDYEIVDFR